MTDTFIAIDNDKQGAPVTIYWAEKIGGSIVIPFFLRNYAQLIDDGHSPCRLFGTNASKAVYAVVDNTVVGTIVFNTQEDRYKTAWIVLSCVNDNYRRRGIYTILHKHFENVLKNEGTRRLASHVHIDNVVMQASSDAVGRKSVFLRKEDFPYIMTEKKVPLL